MNAVKRFALALIVLAVCAPVTLTQQKSSRRPAAKKPAIKSVKAAPVKREIIREIEDDKRKTLGVTIEHYMNNIEVNSDGTATQTWDVIHRLKTQAAVGLFSKVEKIFNRDLELIEVLEASILRSDGKRLPLPQSAIRIIPTAQAEAAPSFSSLMMVEIKFDGLEIGDAIRYKLRLRTIKTHFDRHFDRLDYLAALFDWDSAEINLTAPKDYPIYVQAIDLEGGRLPDEGSTARWQWRKKDFKALEIEDLMMDVMNSSPRLAITSFKNYEELGAAYWREAEKKTALTPELEKLADEITRDLKSPEQQAYAIYEWVNKNIRYLSIVLERGGWIPHDSAQILANRYGDCKDYTTILNSLLRAKGIESYPVIIRSDMTDWFPEVAVSAYFNHAVLYIPSLDLFADATAPYTRLGLIPQTIVGKKAFLAGKKNGVIETPSDKPDDNQLLSDIEVNLSPNGNLKAVSKNSYIGRNEILFRPMFGGIQSLSDTFVPLLLSYYGMQGTGKILKVGNPYKVGEPFTVEMEVELDNYTTFLPSGTLTLPVSLNLFNIFELERFVKAERRRTDLVLGATRLREKFSIVLPEGVGVLSLPGPTRFSNAAGSYRNEMTQEGPKVNIIRELVLSKDKTGAAEYGPVRELITKAVAGFSTDIKYQAAPEFLKAKSKELAKRPPPRPKTFMEIAMGGLYEEKKLTPRQAAQFEAKLKADPSDLETRRRLVRYYNGYQYRERATRVNSRIRHRLWFIENHPEMDAFEVLGISAVTRDVKEPELSALRNAWLKQIEANRSNAKVRLNAFDFLKDADAETAEKLMIEGIEADASNYEYPLRLSKLYHKNPDDMKGDLAAKYIEYARKEMKYGEISLIALKKERSSERDSERRHLLENITQTAFHLEMYDKAKTLAAELVLDFGQNDDSLGYDSASHIGNIILGRVALKEKDPAKAKEYLLIAIKAPLRKEGSWLPYINTDLAKELFAAGERDAVLEYLRLCGQLWNLNNEKELYGYQAKALKLWQEQIRQGKTPSFDFAKP